MATKITVTDPNKGKSITREIERMQFKLHFMRYMYADGTSENYTTFPSLEEPTVYDSTYVPMTDGYDLRASTLRKGYVYVHFEKRKTERNAPKNTPEQKEDNNTLFKEFKVTPEGLINVSADITQDVRTPDDSENQYNTIRFMIMILSGLPILSFNGVQNM